MMCIKEISYQDIPIEDWMLSKDLNDTVKNIDGYTLKSKIISKLVYEESNTITTRTDIIDK